MLKTETCGELTSAHIGQRVTLAGWINRRRDHGGLIFLDLRDRFGITQVTIGSDVSAAAHEAAEHIIALAAEVRLQRRREKHPVASKDHAEEGDHSGQHMPAFDGERFCVGGGHRAALLLRTIAPGFVPKSDPDFAPDFEMWSGVHERHR